MYVCVSPAGEVCTRVRVRVRVVAACTIHVRAYNVLLLTYVYVRLAIVFG